MYARVVIDNDFRYVAALPGGVDRNEAVHFAIELYPLYHVLPIGLKGAAVIVEINARYTGYQPIRNTRRQVAPQLGVPAISPPSRNHVVTFGQLLEESRDVVRVVLKIAVEANNDVTRCMVDPGHHRGGLTEVTPKAYDLKASIFASQLP